MTELNVPLLREIDKNITAHPRHFRMDSWFCYIGEDEGDEEEYLRDFDVILDNGGTCEDIIRPDQESCGTVACLAGWALYLSKANDIYDFNDLPVKAAELLGISEEQGDILFHYMEWPYDIKMQPIPLVKKASLVINRLIADGSI